MRPGCAVDRRADEWDFMRIKSSSKNTIPKYTVEYQNQVDRIHTRYFVPYVPSRYPRKGGNTGTVVELPKAQHYRIGHYYLLVGRAYKDRQLQND